MKQEFPQNYFFRRQGIKGILWDSFELITFRKNEMIESCTVAHQVKGFPKLVVDRIYQDLSIVIGFTGIKQEKGTTG